MASLIVVPVAIAASSPYLPSRNAAYVVAGFAGIVCLGLFLLQPLLGAGYLPGVQPWQARKWHRFLGTGIALCVALHVGGLYLTSPPDTMDALVLASPTPFSVFGVTAMWGIILTLMLVAGRRRLGLRYPAWHVVHNLLALIVVTSTVIHAVQIDGTMGTVSKWVLCVAVLAATCTALVDVRLLRRRRATNIG
ncbi:ferric reductase-like transmembrane domain-containing protein [Yoonia sediminilitoris]|uniref:ferric reductase-like transmembrane domain-containing protein n=1 Tax=Yoonia sediminilitoris TaxID=1286148 RepID=UPI001FE4BD75|nr:ferric reductase-like transmembrane domain-containing protein [Yoonia sediminilitoris]